MIQQPSPRRTEQKTVSGYLFPAQVESVGSVYQYGQNGGNR
jgi:hypothetical protein